MNLNISNDDHLIRQLINHTLISQALLAAYDIGFFEAIGHKKKV